MEHLKYPIGKFTKPAVFDKISFDQHLSTLENFPEKLREIGQKVNLDQTYRPEGWTARQVLHHVSDSHMNMLIRVKWTLTEHTPTIKAYDENKWAQLADYSLPVELAFNQIQIVHTRVCELLKQCTEDDLHKKYLHPENAQLFTLFQVAALYAWHSEHHLGHLQLCLK